MTNALRLPTPEDKFRSMLMERFAALAPGLNNYSPRLGFSLIASPAPTHQLGTLSMGIERYLASGILGGAFVTGQVATLDPVEELAPDYRGLGQYIRDRLHPKRAAVAGVFGAMGTYNDPQNLRSFILDAQLPGQFPGANTQITLDAVIMKWLEDGEKLEKLGYEGLRSEAATQAQQLVDREQQALSRAGRSPVPLKPLPGVVEAEIARFQGMLGTESEIAANYQKAQAILAIVQHIAPNAQVNFRDKGVLGQFFANTTRISNLINFPTEFALRQGGAALHAVGIGGNGPAGFASPGEVFGQVINNPEYAFGEQAARGLGYKPGDREWGAIVNLTNFIAAWTTDPLVATGYAGGALRLARTKPLIEGAIPRGPVGRLFKQIGKSPAEWVTTEGGLMSRDILSLKQSLAASGDLTEEALRAKVADTLNRSSNIPADVAWDFAGIDTIEQGQAILLDRLEAFAIRPESIASLGGKKAALDLRISALKPGTDSYASAVVEQRLVSKRLETLSHGRAISLLTEYPRPSWSKAVRNQLASELAEGRISKAAARKAEQIMSAHIPGTRIGLDMIGLDIPKRRWQNPFGFNSHPGAMETNATQVDLFLRDYLVPTEARKAVTQKLLQAKGPEDWFTVITKDIPEAVARSVDRGYVPGSLGRQAVWFFDQKGERVFGIVETEAPLRAGGVRVAHEPTLYKTVSVPGKADDIQALPSKFVELIDDVIVPDHEHALELTGFWRRFLKSHGDRLHRFWAGDPEARVRGVQGIEDAITGAWKDAILLGRAPAVLFRTQLEQMARIPAAGYASALNRPLEWLKWLRNSDYDNVLLRELRGAGKTTVRDIERAERESQQMLGLIAAQMADRAKEPVKTVRHWYTANPSEKSRILEDLQGGFATHFADQGMKVLARRGPDGFVEWATTAEAGKAYMHEMRDVLAQASIPQGMDPIRYFAETNFREQKLLHQNHPELEKAMRRGYALRDPGGERLAIVRESLDYAAEVRAEANAALEAGDITSGQTLHQQADAIVVQAQADLKSQGIKARPVFTSLEESLEEAVEAGLKERVPIQSEDFVQYLRDLTEHADEAKRFYPAPTTPGWDYKNVANDAALHRMRNFLYRNMLSRGDEFLSRRPLFRQIADRRFKELRALGVPESAAKRQAAFYGASQVSDLLYDLGARTSAQRFFRHLAPFLPAWQEVMTTWMWKLPSRYTPIVGHAYLAQRANLLVKGFQNLGLDPNGDVGIAPLRLLLEHAFGGPDAVPTFKPKDLNLVTQTLFPGLGPIPAVAVGTFAKASNLKFVDTMSEILMPFGVDVQLGPASLNRGYEALVTWINTTYDRDLPTTPIWEVASPEYQDLQYGFAMTDAIRATYQEKIQKGNKPPDPRDFDNADDFNRVNDAWVDDLIHDASQRFVGTYFIRSAISVVSPAPVRITDETKREVNDFYATIEGIARRSPEGKALFDRFLADHPGSDLYLTPSAVRPPPEGGVAGAAISSATGANVLAPTAEDSVFDQILEGQRKKMSDEDFIHLGLGLASRRLFEKQFVSDLTKVGLTTAPSQLSDWYTYSEAAIQRSEAWSRYLDYDTAFKEQWEKLLKGAGVPRQSITIERLRKLMDTAKILADDPFVTDAISRTDLKTIAGEAGRLIEELGGFGDSTDPIAKQRDWWWTNVADPLFAKLDAIRGRAKNAKTTDEKGAILDEIRRVYDQAEPLKGPDGQVYPTVEEYLWGAKSPEEQQALVLKWVLRKPEWLSAAQRDKTGYGGGQNVTDFFNLVNDVDTAYRTALERSHISASSSEGLRLKENAERLIDQKAAELGLQSYEALRTSAPYQRLRDNDTAIVLDDGSSMRVSQSSSMTNAFILADIISERISTTRGLTGEFLSPKGDSQFALALKGQLYQALDDQRKQDQTFDNMWRAIGVAISGPDKTAAWHAYYDAVLFGDFRGV